MKRLWGGVVWGVLAAIATGCASASTGPVENASGTRSPLGKATTQLVTVVTDDWNDFRGTLRRYERAPDTIWAEIGEPIPVVIGREGYGWGRGVHGEGAPAGLSGPEKREGDGRSPAGVFALGQAYGYDAAIEGVSLPYAQATSSLRCVDDPESGHYNQIVDARTTENDWNSAEQMLREDALYAITIVVEHNTDRPAPGGGSCIFLHVWIDENTGMSGCTAMSLEEVQGIARWLQANAAVLVALPKGPYDQLRSAWQLPD